MSRRRSFVLGWLCGGVFLALVVGLRTAKVEGPAYDRGYSAGLAEGLATGTSVPADPDRLCHVRLEQLEDELDAAATCEARLLDHQRTAAANRASARLLGWNDGYAQGRADWRVQPECPR